MSAMKKIKILGVPFDFGQDHVGVRLAYGHFRDHGLFRRLSKISKLELLGELSFPFKLTETSRRMIKHKRLCSLANRQISDHISSLHLSSSFLLNLGGDHGAGLGSIHGILHHHPDTVVIWADAHGDINTPKTSPTGNFHGMPLAFLLGEAVDSEFRWISKRLKPQNLILFGPRELDLGEKEIIKRLGLQYFSSQDINHFGTSEVLSMALHRADPFGIKPIHLSFDVDLFDDSHMKSTGTRVQQGPRLEEIFLLGGFLAETSRLRSMDVVEFNPMIGSEKEIGESCDLVINFLEQTLDQVFQKSFLEKDFFENSSMFA